MINEKNNRTILNNKLTVLSEQIPYMQSFALGVFIKAGSNKDPYNKYGLAHLIEHLSFKKTKFKSSIQISTAFESLGAYFNAFTTKDYICFYARAMTDHFDKILDLLWEVAFYPDFNLSNLRSEKKIVKEEILSYDNDYEDMIFDLADNIIFEGNEYSHQIIGNKKTLANINLDDLTNFHKEYFTFENSIISFIGNINNKTILKKISKLEIDSHQDKIYQKNLLTKNPKLSNSIEIHKPTELVYLLIGSYIPSYNRTDRFALYLLNNILGEGMSSRLNQLLREKHSLAYNVYSSFQLYLNQGAFYIYTEVNKSNYHKAEHLIINEIEKLIIDGVSEEELKKAKEKIKTSVVLEQENKTERMESLVKNELIICDFETQIDFINSIEKINKTQVTNIIKKCFQKKDLKKVAIFPD